MQKYDSFEERHLVEEIMKKMVEYRMCFPDFTFKFIPKEESNNWKITFNDKEFIVSIVRIKELVVNNNRLTKYL